MADEPWDEGFSSETNDAGEDLDSIDSPEPPLSTDDLVNRAVQNLADFPTPDQLDAAEDGLPSTDGEWDAPAGDAYASIDDGGTYGDPSDDDYVASYDTSAYGDPSENDEGYGDSPAGHGQADEDDLPLEDEDSPLARAGDVARGAQKSIKDGINAFRSVRQASQLHSDAREELRAMQEVLEAHTADLQHRIDIEQRYPQIMSEQTAELNEATALLQQSQERARSLEAERADLESQLAIMKDRHEDQLRPYRNVAESTKGRADDAARSLADVKRAVKSAENSLAEASKRRDQRISTANRARDAAQDRLRKIEADIASQQGREEVDTAALTRLQNERVSVQANLDSATADVPVVTAEANKAVETAQQRLFDQNQLLEQVEREAEAAKKEATERRAEYDSLLKKAQDREKTLSDQIKLHVTATEQARKEASDAQARIDVARELLDEAESIHATPQDTIALRDLVSRQQADVDVQQDAVDELAANERELRRGTFKQRLLLVLGAIALLVLIIAIVVAVVFGRKSPKADTTAQPTQVETTKTSDDKKDDAEADATDDEKSASKDDDAKDDADDAKADADDAKDDADD